MPVRKAKSAAPKTAAISKTSTATTPVAAKAAVPAPVAAPALNTTATPKATPAAIDTKAKKSKLVRDSFTAPKEEYAAIEGLKLRAAQQGRLVKKSELLRAGLKLLAGLDDKQLLTALQAVPSIKTGRPAKAEEAPTSPRKPAPRAPAKSKKTAKGS